MPNAHSAGRPAGPHRLGVVLFPPVRISGRKSASPHLILIQMNNVRGAIRTALILVAEAVGRYIRYSTLTLFRR